MISLIQVAYAERPLCGKAESRIGSIAISKAAIIVAKVTATGRAQQAASNNAMSNAND
jgi:hypothetical protein